MLTLEQKQFIDEAHGKGCSVESAKESLLVKKKAEMAKLFAGTPATEKEITAHAKTATKTFLLELNKALHSLAGEVRK